MDGSHEVCGALHVHVFEPFLLTVRVKMGAEGRWMGSCLGLRLHYILDLPPRLLSPLL